MAGWLTTRPSVAVALSGCARQLSQALDVDGCLVFRVEHDGDLALVAADPPRPEGASALRLPAGYGVVGRVAADLIPATLLDDSPRNPLHRQALGLADGQTVSRLCVPARLADGRCAAVLAVHSRRHRQFDPAEVATAQRVADLVALRVWSDAATELIDDYRRQWDAIVAGTVAATEQERRRVAADLHDGVTQTVASLTFHLSAAQLALSDGDAADADALLAQARQLADLAFDETRSAITGLHSPVLEDLGLAAGLVSMARSVPNPPIELEVTELELPEHVAASLFRVAQESVHNAVKHAAANRVVLCLAKHGRMVVLTITDDGRGFEAPQRLSGIPRSPLSGTGYGLDGMAERVRLLGGQLSIRSAPGQGTTIEVTVPDVL